MYFDYCTQVKDAEFIFTPKVLELLRRHKYLKQYGITSYGKHYDDLPAFWLDAVDIMDYNYNMADEWRRKSLT